MNCLWYESFTQDMELSAFQGTVLVLSQYGCQDVRIYYWASAHHS